MTVGTGPSAGHLAACSSVFPDAEARTGRITIQPTGNPKTQESRAAPRLSGKIDYLFGARPIEL